MHAVLYSSSYSMHVVLKIVKCPDIPTFRARNIDIANIRVRIILYTTRTAILTKYAATFVTSKISQLFRPHTGHDSPATFGFLYT